MGNPELIEVVKDSSEVDTDIFLPHKVSSDRYLSHVTMVMTMCAGLYSSDICGTLF